MLKFRLNGFNCCQKMQNLLQMKNFPEFAMGYMGLVGIDGWWCGDILHYLSFLNFFFFLVLLFFQLILLLCLDCPLEIIFLSCFFRFLLYSTSASFFTTPLLDILLQSAKYPFNTTLYYFCSYFYLYVLGDLTPEGEFQTKVDWSIKKLTKQGKLELHFTDVTVTEPAFVTLMRLIFLCLALSGVIVVTGCIASNKHFHSSAA